MTLLNITLQSPHIYRVFEAATGSLMHTERVSARSRIYVRILLIAAATVYEYSARSFTSYCYRTHPTMPVSV